MSFLAPLLPDLAAQFLLGWAVVWIFSPAGGQVPAWRTLGVACAMSLISLGTEIWLSPYVLQGTLVVQWIVFVLLGFSLGHLSLGKSMLAQLCFFSLVLGAGLMREPAADAASAEEERLLRQDRRDPKATEVPEWADSLEQALLVNRLPEIRKDAQQAVYGEKKSPAPDAPPATEPPSTATVEPPDPTEEAEIDPPGMSGSEFEALVYSIPPEYFPTVEPEEESDPADPPLEVIPVQFPEEGGVIGEFTSMNANQTQEITEVRNRSTDPAYAAPLYDIGAVSIGENGRFAMVDGRLLRQGAILRTGSMDPRGWKLHRVTTTELFWQPLK